MEYRFPLGASGILQLREEGPRATAEARLPDDGQGLYKVYLTGGSRVLLGTLIPERGALLLRRTLSIDSLRRQGVWPPTGAEAVLAFSPQTPHTGWHRTDHPEGAISDPLLRRAVAALPQALLRRDRDGFSLALPWTSGQPFPLTPLFCLSRPQRLEGHWHLVFSFDSAGRPVIPPGPAGRER